MDILTDHPGLVVHPFQLMLPIYLQWIRLSGQDYRLFLFAWMALAVITFFVLLRVAAPYGRHVKSGWGPQVSNRLGWIIMEVPVMIVLLYFVLTAVGRQTAVTWVMIGLFCFHYVHRTFVFPFRIHTRGKTMPWVIVLSAIGFNLVNGFALGYYFTYVASYPGAWFSDPRFLLGSVLFFGGMLINWKADNDLIRLRKPGETHYALPDTPLFRKVSCPNLLAELVEWLGYAVLCWSLPALAFFIWTAANLVPRAISHHRWYQNTFPDYPAERKAIIPYVI